MTKNTGICRICKNPVEECMCCDGCGHVCSLDRGEPYCPVCLPQPESPKSDDD